jgi:hypothetical protein
MSVTVEGVLKTTIELPDYKRAVIWRVHADLTGNVELYRRAAAEFRALGMTCAAERCDEKARHYEVTD